MQIKNKVSATQHKLQCNTLVLHCKIMQHNVHDIRQHWLQTQFQIYTGKLAGFFGKDSGGSFGHSDSEN